MKIIRTNARVESGGGTVHTDILYADLLALINNNKLVPNTSYRITNYTTTTTQTDTQSAGHDFDIIVTALSTNKLSEIASCVRKEGDTYFENAKLETWEIKYCIANDTNRFAWANTVNGKGVIYYMKDEWGNECPYDFKNIQFKKSSVFLYTFGGTADGSLAGICHHNTMLEYMSGYPLLKLTLNFNTFGNNCTNNTFATACRSNTFDDYCYSNTFGNQCHSNTFGSNCNNNRFGDSCDSNTFGTDCRSNIFDGGCQNITFGTTCWYNKLGNGCYNNRFGVNCQSNTFGVNCQSNKFGDHCSSNTFGYNCNSNTFGNSCDSNTFGTECGSNTFGTDCSSNTFGNECSSNTLGNECSSNTLGNECSSNTLGNYCNSNMFGDSCRGNNFYAGASGTTKKNYISYIALEDGCIWNNFYSTLTTSSNNYLQRIRIKGLDNTNTQITLSTVNTKYEWLICYTSSGTLKQYCPND